MVSQEQKCIWIISQVWPSPSFLLSGSACGVGPGEASPSFPLSGTLLVGVGEGLISVCRLTLLPEPVPDGSAEAPWSGGGGGSGIPECLS